MAQLQITPKTRIALENTLAAQTGTARELRVIESVLDKLTTTQEYRREYLRPVHGGGLDWDEGAIALAELFTLDLEREECRRVVEVLDSWPRFTGADMRWVSPLRRTLQQELDAMQAGVRRI